MFVVIEHHTNGPRVRVAGQRLHHGAFGCLLLAFRRTRTVGFLLCADDAHDWRAWFKGGWQ
jgi:hypothetical protein